MASLGVDEPAVDQLRPLKDPNWTNNMTQKLETIFEKIEQDVKKGFERFDTKVRVVKKPTGEVADLMNELFG